MSPSKRLPCAAGGLVLACLISMAAASCGGIASDETAQRTAAIVSTTSAPPSDEQLIRTPIDAREQFQLSPLREVPVPQIPELDEFVRDRNALLVLGKALFWDMQTGSDGVQSCATCHFHAFADNRPKNQLDPAILRVAADRQGNVEGFFRAATIPDFTFQTGGPNHVLSFGDFPFVKDIGGGDENGANVVPVDGTVGPAPGNSNDIASSQGVHLTIFVDTVPGQAVDIGTPQDDPTWNVAGVTVRRAEPRNTPTAIDAVFNFANFWDGRANPVFNGVTPFGRQDPDAVIYVARHGTVETRKIALHNASLASQAVGPPVSPFEMSFLGRTWPDIGKKMVPMTPLAKQAVSPHDSVLAGYRDTIREKGLATTYRELIERAFRPKYWKFEGWLSLGSTEILEELPGKPFRRWTGNLSVLPEQDPRPPETYWLIEANFSLFFGLAVQFYETTLIADQTPFDRWMMTGAFNEGFGPNELAGLNTFVGKGRCINCHGGAEFTNASVRRTERGRNAIEPMLMGDEQPAMYDEGFYNISVTPTVDDICRGGPDPFGRPLAFSRQFAFEALGIQDIPFPIFGDPIDDLVRDPAGQSDILGFIDSATQKFEAVCRDRNHNGRCSDKDELLLRRVAVDGSFKAAALRNAELTGPYFHNGSLATLREVVQFYNRGGNFCRFNRADLDPDIEPIGLTDTEQNGLVAFLISLTDPRVKRQSAPFDHPELFIPNGHPGDERVITDVILTANGVRQAGDDLLTIPAVGAAGGRQLRTFLEVNPQRAIPVAGGNCSQE